MYVVNKRKISCYLLVFVCLALLSTCSMYGYLMYRVNTAVHRLQGMGYIVFIGSPLTTSSDYLTRLTRTIFPTEIGIRARIKNEMVVPAEVSQYLSDVSASVVSLDLSNLMLDLRGFGALKKMRRLRLLTVNLRQIPHSRISELGPALIKIQRLDIDAPDMVDTDIAWLRQCTELTSIRLHGSKITDETLVALSHCQKLDWLSLSGTQISETGLSAIAGMPRLKFLAISNTKFGDSAAEFIRRSRDLKEIILWNTKITDEFCHQLHGNCRLEQIHFVGTRVTRSGAQDLFDSNPSIMVVTWGKSRETFEHLSR